MRRKTNKKITQALKQLVYFKKQKKKDFERRNKLFKFCNRLDISTNKKLEFTALPWEKNLDLAREESK